MTATAAIAPEQGAAEAAPAVCPRQIHLTRSRVDRISGVTLDVDGLMKPCGSKGCPVCGPKLAARYVAHYTKKFLSLPSLRFCTITVDAKIGLEAEDSRQYMLHTWQKYRKRLKRIGDCHFLATWEQHDGKRCPSSVKGRFWRSKHHGYWHLHMVISSPATDEQLRSAGFDCGFGAVMDIQHLPDATTDEGAKLLTRKLGYIMKYATKDASDRPGFRSLMCSRGLSYHSADAKAERQAHARGIATDMADDDTVIGQEVEALRQRIERLSGEGKRVRVIGHDGIFVQGPDLPHSQVEVYQEDTGVVQRVDRGDLRPIELDLDDFCDDDFSGPATGGNRRAYADTPTPEQRRRFDEMNLLNRTFTYREHKNGLLIVHTYETVNGQTVYSKVESPDVDEDDDDEEGDTPRDQLTFDV